MKTELINRIKETIDLWDESDIYVVSLFVYDNEDNPREPTVTLGYNTEEQYSDELEYAYNEQEARWNYACWIQNEEMVFGIEETQPIVKKWISDMGYSSNTDEKMYESENDKEESTGEEITKAFVKVLIEVVKELHSSGYIKKRFGRELPVLIHELEYYDEIADQNIEANGMELVANFVAFCKDDSFD